MKILMITLVVLTLAYSPASAWEGYVTATSDGDSLKVKRGNRIYEIRLYGIDCPEYGQSYWRDAGGFTRVLVLGQRVSVEPLGADRYGRIVALVRKQGRLLNSELVRNGLAWTYPRYCHAQPLCNDLELLQRGARRQRLGLWREKAPQSPWSWRRGRQ